jgi:acetoin utilization deacetylase AcuC-like enzyme
MPTILFSHPACARHRPPTGHPERPERLAAVLAGLAGLDLDRREAPEAAAADLRLIHPQEHLDRLAAAEPAQGEVALDPDSWLSPGSLAAARRAAGGALAAVAAVMGGQAPTAFVATRPPGHHALAARAMGFCLFANLALAARAALDRHGAARVAVVDFDVHHGNGTEALLEGDPRVLIASAHQWPFWPGTGAADHEGPHGTVVNLPLPAGTDGRAFRRAVERRLLPRLDAHRPELILVSAGFDADGRDPLGGLDLGPADFGWITREIRAVAKTHGRGRVVSVLEGGYDLAALAEGAAAHVAALEGDG